MTSLNVQEKNEFSKFSKSLNGSLNSISVYKPIKGKIYMKIPKNSGLIASGMSVAMVIIRKALVFFYFPIHAL